MSIIEYIAEILPDGHLSLPEEIRKKLNLKVHSRLHIALFPLKENKGLTRFCGKWQDKRDADEIIAEIINSREKNIRSGRVKL